jgi:hypothetical protein
MEHKLTVLKLFLDALGVESNIADVNGRKAMQKAVYLGQQLSGVDLGYRYGWYKMGPYCSALTEDYYNLSRALRFEKDVVSDKALPTQISAKLKSLQRLFSAPANWPLGKEDWLELNASYHYLINVRRRNHDEALKILSAEKPKLAPYVDEAVNILECAPV